MDYTTKQMEYINSVGGKAHASAVRIIGYLEHELEAAKASSLVFVPAMSDDMAETYLSENIQLHAEIAKKDEMIEQLAFRSRRPTAPDPSCYQRMKADLGKWIRIAGENQRSANKSAKWAEDADARIKELEEALKVTTEIKDTDCLSDIYRAVKAAKQALKDTP